MVRATRTLNPLHFEDLEPHRFEDLIRQLVYTYRPWRYLEATGRLGRDEGIDIRGVENVVSGAPSIRSEEEEEVVPIGHREREWRIQCKRYKEIGPTLMRKFVAEVLPDGAETPYGVILAVACDVSAETLAVFREETIARGVTEAHLWTKAHLEDLLFLPQHDQLLFAYFGISLGVKMRSDLQRVRDYITLKRKLLRAFDVDTVTQPLMVDILVRDVEEERYPYHAQVPSYKELECPPWHSAVVEHFHVQGLVVRRYNWDGWVKPDGSWDILTESRRSAGSIGWEIRFELDTQEERETESQKRQTGEERYAAVPESERQHVRELWLIPYGQILEVDPVGDPAYEGPHLYCRFLGQGGPYAAGPFYIGAVQTLDPDKRTRLFRSNQ